MAPQVPETLVRKTKSIAELFLRRVAESPGQKLTPQIVQMNGAANPMTSGLPYASSILERRDATPRRGAAREGARPLALPN